VPQLALLKGGHFHAVVSHGGHNTVCESLAHGVPLVVTPIRDDQPVIAEQVVRAGAGLRLKFGRLSPAALRDAIGRVLEEAPFAEAAARVQASFAAAGGAPKAASLLEELAS
jgi:UDP:flavonoid glycosyltransferase YjiC (YdhE family)